MFNLLHLLEVDVGYVFVVTVAALRALRAAVEACAAVEALVLGALGTALSVGSVVHVLTCCVEGVVEGFHCAVDTSDISVFMCCFKVFEGLLDRGFLVGRYLVAELFELFLGLEDSSVGLVEFLDTFALAFVGIGIGFRLSFNTLNLFIAKVG